MTHGGRTLKPYRKMTKYSQIFIIPMSCIGEVNLGSARKDVYHYVGAQQKQYILNVAKGV